MAETITKEIVKKPSEPLLSKRRKRFVLDPLSDDNPITIQVLGICSALAVTTQLKPTIVMALSVTFVLVFSSLFTSILRNLIPNRVRIIVQLAVVASLVSLVNEVLHAYAFDVYKQLSVFVGLIITNCIVMGRLEAFAMGNKPYDSVLDAFGSAMGYSWIIITVAFFRELLGSGKLFGFPILESIGWHSYPPNGLMVSPVGAFIILGLIVWVQRIKTGYIEQH